MHSFTSACTTTCSSRSAIIRSSICLCSPLRRSSAACIIIRHAMLAVKVQGAHSLSANKATSPGPHEASSRQGSKQASSWRHCTPDGKHTTCRARSAYSRDSSAEAASSTAAASASPARHRFSSADCRSASASAMALPLSRTPAHSAVMVRQLAAIRSHSSLTPLSQSWASLAADEAWEALLVLTCLSALISFCCSCTC